MASVGASPIILHLFKLVCIGSANEVSLHVVDVTLRVHQILLVFPFDLDAAHHYVVLYVDAFFLFITALEVLASSSGNRNLLLHIRIKIHLHL